MPSRVDWRQLQQLSLEREADAKTLLEAARWSASYYLGGYAVECALKSCTARAVRPGEFPDKKFASQVWTHDLEYLMKYAGLDLKREEQAQANAPFAINWRIVKGWSEACRYAATSEIEARDFLRASTDTEFGVLPWVREHW